MDQDDLPLGFGMALAQHPDAMKRFTALSEARQAEVLQQVHAVTSKDEMQALVCSLASQQ